MVAKRFLIRTNLRVRAQCPRTVLVYSSCLVTAEKRWLIFNVRLLILQGYYRTRKDYQLCKFSRPKTCSGFCLVFLTVLQNKTSVNLVL